MAMLALSTSAGIVLGISLNRPISSQTSNLAMRPVAPISNANEPGGTYASDSLLNTIVAAEAVYSGDGTYSAVTPSLLSGLDAHVTLIGPSSRSTNPAEVSLLAAPQHITISVRATADLCVFALAIKAQASELSYHLFKVPRKGTYYASTSGTNCAASAAPGNGWSTTFP
ncbi:MAG: hypothetical protein M1350_02890 [Actinobacteria bacterium]|nr:hypothetical protein [Actinomycetota bacterium]